MTLHQVLATAIVEPPQYLFDQVDVSARRRQMRGSGQRTPPGLQTVDAHLVNQSRCHLVVMIILPHPLICEHHERRPVRGGSPHVGSLVAELGRLVQDGKDQLERAHANRPMKGRHASRVAHIHQSVRSETCHNIQCQAFVALEHQLQEPFGSVIVGLGLLLSPDQPLEMSPLLCHQLAETLQLFLGRRLLCHLCFTRCDTGSRVPVQDLVVIST